MHCRMDRCSQFCGEPDCPCPCHEGERWSGEPDGWVPAEEEQVDVMYSPDLPGVAIMLPPELAEHFARRREEED